MPPATLTAVLAQVAAAREHHATLDAREAAHHADVTSQLTLLSGRVATLGTSLAEHTAALGRLDDLAHQVADLAHRPPGPGSDDTAAYHPRPAPAWWKLAPGDRQDPVAELRDWTERVYRPGYGHLASLLAPCWAEHDLCLYALDIASQLWCALYLQPERTTRLLSAQTDYQVRILPEIAAQLAAETARCGHQPAAYPRSVP